MKFVFRDFPINDNPSSTRASEAAECARDQDHYWQYFDLLFEHEGEITRSALLEIASGLNLDIPEFSSCLDSAKYLIEVRKDKRDAQAAGVSGTPSFFINGNFLPGARTYEDFKMIIEQELARFENSQKKGGGQ